MDDNFGDAVIMLSLDQSIFHFNPFEFIYKRLGEEPKKKRAGRGMNQIKG